MKNINIDSLRSRISKARDTVNALCSGEKRWAMHVPARPDEDPDLVISDGLLAGREAITALEAATVLEMAPASDVPLDGHGIDGRLASALADAWTDIIDETGRAPPDFWVADGRLGFRPDLLVARAGADIERLIEDEVEKRLLAIQPVDSAAIPIDEREKTIRLLSTLLQRVGRVLLLERRRHRREIDETLRSVGVPPTERKASAR